MPDIAHAGGCRWRWAFNEEQRGCHASEDQEGARRQGYAVEVTHVEGGLCGALRQGGATQIGSGHPHSGHICGFKFSREDPETLIAITDCEDVAEEIDLHCLKAHDSARWHSLHVRMDPMESPSRLSWVEGHMDPFSWAHFFAFFEDIEVDPRNASALLPLYNLIVGRNNAVRKRPGNPHPPPWFIPRELEHDFTLDGAIAVSQLYYDQSEAGALQDVAMGRYAATRSQVDRLVEKAAARSSNYYGDTDKFLFEALARGAREEGGWGLRGRNVIIVGSLVPWYEAICLAEDAASCTTVDHNRVAFEHPHLQHLTIQDWNAMEEPRPLWDMAVSISSVEHAGLGRYGDPIDPDGDLRAMDMIRAMVKPGGYLLLAVPVGADVIKWNAHRKYGRLRLPVLLHRWSLVAQVGLTAQLLDDVNPDTHIQPVFVLKNDQEGAETRSGRREASEPAVRSRIVWEMFL